MSGSAPSVVDDIGLAVLEDHDAICYVCVESLDSVTPLIYPSQTVRPWCCSAARSYCRAIRSDTLARGHELRDFHNDPPRWRQGVKPFIQKDNVGARRHAAISNAKSFIGTQRFNGAIHDEEEMTKTRYVDFMRVEANMDQLAAETDFDAKYASSPKLTNQFRVPVLLMAVAKRVRTQVGLLEMVPDDIEGQGHIQEDQVAISGPVSLLKASLFVCLSLRRIPLRALV